MSCNAPPVYKSSSSQRGHAALEETVLVLNDHSSVWINSKVRCEKPVVKLWLPETGSLINKLGGALPDSSTWEISIR